MHPNTHRHPERKPEAEARQKDWASLSTADQIKALDARLGKGVGASKQRARLSGAKKAAPAPEVPQVAAKATSEEVGTEAAPVSTKKQKAKERRAKAAEAS